MNFQNKILETGNVIYYLCVHYIYFYILKCVFTIIYCYILRSVAMTLRVAGKQSADRRL